MKIHLILVDHFNHANIIIKNDNTFIQYELTEDQPEFKNPLEFIKGKMIENSIDFVDINFEGYLANSMVYSATIRKIPDFYTNFPIMDAINDSYEFPENLTILTCYFMQHFTTIKK